MKRIAITLCAALGLALTSSTAQAAHGLCYGGHQPWWNLFAKRDKCMTPEDKRLNRFWHDYYNSLKNYYGCLDNLDWVAYYKNHGYPMTGGCEGPYGNPTRIHYAPVFVSPTLQWAMPNCAPVQYAPPAAPCPAPGCVVPAGYMPGY